jgi:hypothetical protein
MSGYLTSGGYAQDAPEVLIWRVPVWMNAGLHGPQQMAEIVAAAADNCAEVPGAYRSNDGALSADLHGSGNVLRLDAGSAGIQKVTVRVEAPDGRARVRQIQRTAADTVTPRMFVSLAGMGLGGASHLRASVTLSPEPKTAPEVSLCQG